MTQLDANQHASTDKNLMNTTEATVVNKFAAAKRIDEHESEKIVLTRPDYSDDGQSKAADYAKLQESRQNEIFVQDANQDQDDSLGQAQGQDQSKYDDDDDVDDDVDQDQDQDKDQSQIQDQDQSQDQDQDLDQDQDQSQDQDQGQDKNQSKDDSEDEIEEKKPTAQHINSQSDEFEEDYS